MHRDISAKISQYHGSSKDQWYPLSNFKKEEERNNWFLKYDICPNKEHCSQKRQILLFSFHFKKDIHQRLASESKKGKSMMPFLTYALSPSSAKTLEKRKADSRNIEFYDKGFHQQKKDPPSSLWLQCHILEISFSQENHRKR